MVGSASLLPEPEAASLEVGVASEVEAIAEVGVALDVEVVEATSPAISENRKPITHIYINNTFTLRLYGAHNVLIMP